MAGKATRSYGEHARVALTSTSDAIEITIDDDGPGLLIPAPLVSGETQDRRAKKKLAHIDR